MLPFEDNDPQANAGLAETSGTDSRSSGEVLRASQLKNQLINRVVTAFSFAYRVETDRSVKLEWITAEVTEVLGYSASEIKGLVSFRSRIHPSDRVQHQNTLEQVLAGQQQTVEFRFLTKNGEQRWLQSLSQPEWSRTENRVIRIVGATQDITARKLAEDALKNSEERLRLSLEVTNMGSWDWNLMTNEITSDPKLRAMFTGEMVSGLKQERDFFEFIHRDDAAPVQKAIQSAIEGNGQYHAVFRVVWKDGSIHWLEGRGKVFKDAEGQPWRLMGVTADITERRAIERRAETYATLAHALNGTNSVHEAGRLIVNVADELIGWDSAIVILFNESTGLCRSVLTIDVVDGAKRDVISTFHDRPPSPRFRKTIEQGAELILRHNLTEQAEGYALFGNKTRRSASLMFVPIRDGKRTVGMLSIQSYKQNAYTPDDLATVQTLADQCAAALARIRSQEIQHESEQRLRASLENTPNVCVQWFDDEGRVLYWNPASESVFGWKSSDAIGKTLDALILDVEQTKSFRSHLQLINANGKPIGPVEFYFKRRNGKPGVCLSTMFAIPTSGGSKQFVCMDVDITDRKLAEETLRKMQFSVDHAGDSVFWVSREGRIFYANNVAWASRGYTREEILGMTVFDLDPEFPREIWGTHWNDLKQRGTITLESRHRKKDGSVFPIEVNANYVSFGEQEFNCAFVRNITDRKRAEEALRASEQQFADLVNNIDGIVWEGDAQTLATTFVSFQAERILGYSLKDWIANKTFWQDHVHPDDREKAVDYCLSQTQLGLPLDFEYRMIAADGRIVWMRDLVVVTSKDGKPATMRGIMVDITKRKQAEQSLRASEQHFKSLFDSAPDAVFVIGLEAEEKGRILAANRAAADMHGFTIEELTSMTILQLDAPDAASASKERMNKLLAGERQSFEVEHYRKDGSLFPLEVTAELMVVENKRYILAFDRDITERKTNELLLSDQKRILEMIASGNSLKQTLTELCLTIEHQCTDTRCSIMLTDEEGLHLHSFAAPNLPDEYVKIADGIAIGPCAGSCGTAAHRGETVIVEDIATDPLWAQYAAIAARFGFRACWSTPIFDKNRRLIGTFAVYRDVPSRPSHRDIANVDSATHTAAVAIQKQEADEQLARSREVLRQLSVNLFETQEIERRHLARELHDEIGQTLTATKIILQSVKNQEGRVPLEGAAYQSINPDNSAMLANAVQHVDHLLQIVRNLSLNLRPPMLDDFGLVSALRWLLDQHTKATGRVVEFTSDYNIESPDATVETACFRIAQEALTNVTRHSQAKKVSVHLRVDDSGIHLAVADDGVGFNVNQLQRAARRGNSLGLLSMQERTGLVGGQLDIHSSPGTGTTVQARFPLASPPENTAS